MSNKDNWQEQPTVASKPNATRVAPASQPGQYPNPPQGQQFGTPAPGAPVQQPSGWQGQQYPSQPGGSHAQPGYPSAPGQGGYPQGQPAGAPQFGGYASGPQGQPYAPQPGQPGQQFGQPAYGSYPSGPQQGQPYGQPPMQQGYQAPFHGQPQQGGSSWQPVGPSGMGGGEKPGLGRLAAWVALGCALLALVGVFGTWVHAVIDAGFGSSESSSNGIGMISSSSGESRSDGDVKDGWFVLIFALIVGALAVLRALGKLKRPFMWAGTALGVIGAGICLYDWIDLSRKVSEVKDTLGASIDIGAGWGLYLSLFACLALAASSALSALKE